MSSHDGRDLVHALLAERGSRRSVDAHPEGSSAPAEAVRDAPPPEPQSSDHPAAEPIREGDVVRVEGGSALGHARVRSGETRVVVTAHLVRDRRWGCCRRDRVVLKGRGGTILGAVCNDRGMLKPDAKLQRTQTAVGRGCRIIMRNAVVYVKNQRNHTNSRSGFVTTALLQM